MILYLKKYGDGYLGVRLSGNSPERFLNLCKCRGIYLWDITNQGEEYQFKICLEDYKRIRPIARKTKTIPYITWRTGLPFQIQKWKRRYGFCVGVLLFFSILYYLSLFIWSVEIEGEYTHTKEALLRFLKEDGVRVGSVIDRIHCTEVEEKMRETYSDIGWVSVQITGTKLKVEIRETNMPVLYEKSSTPVHIVAEHDGTVMSIMTREGTPLVKEGDKVKKGDILISGIIDVVGDFDTILLKEPVVADGDVVIRTKYTYEDRISMDYADKVYTGKVKKWIQLSSPTAQRNFSLPLTMPFSDTFQEYDCIRERQELFGISYDRVSWREYQTKKKEYTKQEAADILSERFQSFQKKIIEKGVIIQKNNVRIEKNGGEYTAFGTVYVLEPATSCRKVLDSEWRNLETDEHNGDEN